jgi:hypothetical protein
VDVLKDMVTDRGNIPWDSDWCDSWDTLRHRVVCTASEDSGSSEVSR